MRHAVRCPLLVALVLLGVGASSVRAEPPGALVDRALILEVEMRRGPAERLAPYLAEDVNAFTRQLAIRALGRIGDHGAAPSLLEGLLEAGGPDLPLALWSAGIARTASLADAIAAHLTSDDVLVVAAAASALGWTGAPGTAARLSPYLQHESEFVRAAALVGLSRAGEPTVLERVARLLDDPSRHVQDAAELAMWRLASHRRDAASKALGDGWDGDSALARRLLGRLEDEDVDRRLGALRPLGLLLPGSLDGDPAWKAAANVVKDADARVVQECVARILAPREGAVVDGALVAAADHGDAKVRGAVIDALADHATPLAVEALEARWAAEEDARLRDALAVALTRVGREALVAGWTEREGRPEDAVVRHLAEARALLASPRPEALEELFAWLDPAAPHGARHPHAAVWMEVASALEDREHEQVDAWLDWMVAYLGELRPHVKAAIVELVGARGAVGHLDDLLALEAEDADVARSLAEALGALGRREALPEGAPEAIADRLGALTLHPSAFVRDAAREARGAIGLEPLPEDAGPGRANDWRGLPRPATALLGHAPGGEGPWLDETAILELVEHLEWEKARVILETTAGRLVIELETDHAPVHCANLALAAHAGVYDGTRWHRVVPSFVIQGGDPHGHGAGHAGWTVPDEISALSFARGRVGMPKSVKDDGGCQIFVMHTDYRPLDERYTVFGRLVEGFDALDAIRVGDRIVRASVERGPGADELRPPR